MFNPLLKVLQIWWIYFDPDDLKIISTTETALNMAAVELKRTEMTKYLGLFLILADFCCTNSVKEYPTLFRTSEEMKNLIVDSDFGFEFCGKAQSLENPGEFRKCSFERATDPPTPRQRRQVRHECLRTMAPG